MYIDVVPNRNSPPAILLRETRRQGKRIVKVTLANLSPLPPQRIDMLRRALKGELDELAFCKTPAALEQGPSFGALFYRLVGDQTVISAPPRSHPRACLYGHAFLCINARAGRLNLNY
jgi:hypothetical protein